MWLQIFTLCVLFTITPCAPNINYLGSVTRNENYLDSYYVCDTCGRTVQWFVNSESAGGFSADSEIGTTRVGRLKFARGIEYSTVLLLIENTTCRTVLLVVSHPYGKNLSVVCRGEIEVAFTNDSSFQLSVLSVQNSTAKLDYLYMWNYNNVVPSYSIALFTCNIQGLSMHWQIDGLLIGHLNSQMKSGVHLFPESGIIAVAILINDQPGAENGTDHHLKSVLVVLNNNLTDSFNVTCGSFETSVTQVVYDSSYFADFIVIDSIVGMKKSSTAMCYPSTHHMENSTTETSLGKTSKGRSREIP